MVVATKSLVNLPLQKTTVTNSSMKIILKYTLDPPSYYNNKQNVRLLINLNLQASNWFDDLILVYLIHVTYSNLFLYILPFVKNLYESENHLVCFFRLYITIVTSKNVTFSLHILKRTHTVKSYSSGLFSLFTIMDSENANSNLPVNPGDVPLSFYPTIDLMRLANRFLINCIHINPYYFFVDSFINVMYCVTVYIFIIS